MQNLKNFNGYMRHLTVKKYYFFKSMVEKCGGIIYVNSDFLVPQNVNLLIAKSIIYLILSI